MPHYRRMGEVPRKRHTVLRGGDGVIRGEELMGHAGFSQESSLLYHRGSPSALVGIEPIDEPAAALTPNVPVTPVHLHAREVAPGDDLVGARRVLAGNDDVHIAYARSGAGVSPLYRNAAGDEVVYFQRGGGALESVFGRLSVQEGDYVVIPKATTHRWRVDDGTEALVIEATGHVQPPAKYLSERGQLLEGAPYSERDQRGPEELVEEEGTDVPVLVKTAAGMTRHVYETHPFDVVGWDGCLYPWALSIHDFEPIVGRIHQPPPVHQTFGAPGAVICSFVPRLLDTDPDAVKVPYHHSNADCDEVLFYSQGQYFGRVGVGEGSLTIHPAGFVHGPQPGALERSLDRTETNEVAVMLDAFQPLLLSDAARGVTDPEYTKSWLR
jgi:homogentisate 1,2-dioxygenase